MKTGTLIARNIAATLGTQVISWGLAFAATLFLPGYVGADGLGTLTVAASLSGLIGLVLPMGTSTVLVREIPRDRERAGELLQAAVILRLLFGLLLAGLISGITFVVASRDLALLVTLGAAGAVIASVNDAFTATLQGQERLPQSNASALVEKVIASAGTVLLVLQRAPIWTFVAVGALASLSSLIAQASLVGLKKLRETRPSTAVLRTLALAGLPFLGWNVLRFLYSQTDPLIIASIAGNTPVGWYALASRFIGTTLFVPTALAAALLPTLSRLYRDDPEAYGRLAFRFVGLVSLCAAPLAVLFGGLPEQILITLRYPASFDPAIPVLRLGALSVVLYFTGVALGTLLIVKGEERALARMAGAACLVGIPACFAATYLAHRLLGNAALGALASDILLECFLVACYLRALRQDFRWGWELRPALLPFACAVPMLLTLKLASTALPLLWAAVLASLVYLAACTVTRCIEISHLLTLRTLLQGRGG